MKRVFPRVLMSIAASVFAAALMAQTQLRRPIASIALPATPRSIAVSPTTNTIYVTADDRNLYAIDGVTLKLRGPLIPLDCPNTQLTLDPAGPNGDLLHLYDPCSSEAVWLFEPTMEKPTLRFFGGGLVSTLVLGAREPIFATEQSGFGAVRTFPNPRTLLQKFGAFRRNLAVNAKTQMLYALHTGLVAYNPTFNLATDITVNGGTPSLVDVNPVTGRVYVSATTPRFPSFDRVSVIEGNGVRTALPITTVNGDLTVSSTSNRIFTSNDRGEIYAIDGATHQSRQIAWLGFAGLLTLNQNTGRLYTMTTTGLAEVDTTGAVPVFISSSAQPPAPPLWMTNIVANQVTNRIYLTGDRRLFIFDGTTARVAARVKNPGASGIRAMSLDAASNETFIAHGSSNNVTVIVGASGNSTPSFRNIATATTPVAMATNPVNHKTYVVNSGSLLQAGSVDIIQRPGIFVSKNVKVGFNPVAVAVNPETGRAYVANAGGTIGRLNYPPSVSVIDANDTVVATIRIFTLNPTDIAVDHYRNRIAVAHGDAGVTLIDETMHTVVTRFIKPGASSVAVSSFSGLVYLAHPKSNSVTWTPNGGGAFDTATFDIPVGSRPIDVAINESTNRVYVLNEGSKDVSVINGNSDEGPISVIATIPLGGVGTSMYVDEGSNRVLVTIDDSSNHGLAVIDGSSNSVSFYPLSGAPNHVTANPRTSTVYVGDSATNEIAILDLSHSDRPEPRARLTQTLPADTSPTRAPTFSVTVDNANRGIPLRQVYYQIDTFSGPWLRAAIQNGVATFTPILLSDGPHVLYFMASDEESRSPRRDSGGASETIRVGAVSSYFFTVKKP